VSVIRGHADRGSGPALVRYNERGGAIERDTP
jgi:hypothetical protein